MSAFRKVDQADAAWTRILLTLPASQGPDRLHASSIGNGPRAEASKFAEFLKNAGASLDIAPYMQGRPLPARPRPTHSKVRPEPTGPRPSRPRATLGTGDGPYVVDTLTSPDENPYHSWMRFGGMDFFADGKSAALSAPGAATSGPSPGIDATRSKKLTWKRFATGLFQPLGLRRSWTKESTSWAATGSPASNDLNGDGEADFYEAFNHDMAVTTGFHEFAFDLQTDPEGNFYFAKAGAGEERRPGVRHHRRQQRRP